MKGSRGKSLGKSRSELAERSFVHLCETGGHRRCWLRGLPKVKKRYLINETHSVKATTEDVYRFKKDGEVVCFCSSEWHNVGISHFYPEHAGNYRFRISASSIQTGGKPLPFRVTVGIRAPLGATIEFPRTMDSASAVQSM